MSTENEQPLFDPEFLRNKVKKSSSVDNYLLI
jgi:hypothetical protein